MQRSNLFIVAACAALTLASLPAAAQPVYQSATTAVGWPGRSFFDPGAAAVAAADLDGDNVLDLVFVSPNDPRTAILKGTGGGNFAAPRYHMMGSGSDQVAVADIDRNGRPDFILSSSRETGIRVIYTFEDGHATGSVFSTSRKVGSLAVADLNQDGFLDLIATAADAPSVMVLTQVPHMTEFQETVEPTQALPSRFALADMNGDGYVDLVIGTAQGFEIHHKGPLADGVPPGSPVTIAGGLDDIAAGDFSKDGIADVIGLQKAAGVVVTIQGRSGPPSFVAPGPSGYPAFSAGPSPAGLTVSDLEGDGWLDVVVVNEFMPNGTPGTMLRVLSGGSVLDHGVEKFTLTLGNGYTTGPQPHAVLLADVNGDTLPDLVTANLGAVGHSAPQSDVSILFRQVTAADLLRVISSLTTLQQQNVALAAQVQTERQQTLAVTAQLYGAQAQNLTLSTQNGELQAQVAALTGQVTSLTEDKANLTAQAAQLTSERDTARAANAPLTAQVEALTAEQKITNAQIASLEAANTQLGEDKAALQISLDAANARVAPLAAQVEALIVEQKITNAQIHALQNANAQLGEDNAALQAALTAANTSLTAANASLAAASANLASMTASLAAANQTVASQGQQMASLNQHVSTLAAQVASLTAALAHATDGIAEGLAAIEQDLQRTFRNPRFQLPGDTLEEQLDAVAGALQDLNRGAKQDLYRDLGGRRVPHRGHHRR